MAHREDVPYVIIERRSGSAAAFLWGALLGAGAALLLAPRSGRETRDEIRASALRLRDCAEDTVRSVTGTVGEAIGGVRGEVEDRLDRAREAFEAGRDAARRSREQMEMRVREVRSGVRGGIDAARRSTAGARGPDSTPDPDPAADDGDSERGV
jgi:gas vesicle protein